MILLCLKSIQRSKQQVLKCMHSRVVLKEHKLILVLVQVLDSRIINMVIMSKMLTSRKSNDSDKETDNKQ